MEDYKKKLEAARNLLKIAKEQQNEIGVNILEDLFPELKESEDEKIRKKIIESLQKYIPTDEILEEQEMIAWLEKQGEHANFISKIQVGDKVTRNEAGDLINLSQLERVAKPSQCKSEHYVEVCGDNRFDIIEKAKKEIISSTNIETRPEEMAVLDNFLYRCWQMGWLEKYEEQKPACSDEDIEKDIIDYLRYERKSTSQEIEERFIPFLKKIRIMKQESISPISYDSLDEAMQEAGRRFDLPYTDENKYSIADVFYAGVRAERESKTWSYEDEKIRKGLINMLSQDKELHGEGINWLKSIKPNH